MPADWASRFSPYAQRAGGAETRAFLRLVGQPGLISFAGGVPDSNLFPSGLIAEAHARIFADPKLSQTALQYSVSEGWPPLREWIAQHMRSKGVPCGIENILITSGSQQALYLSERLLLGEGDGALTERPTYLGLLHAFAGNNPKYGPLSALEGEDRVSAKLAYVMPDFANPSGESYSLAARQRLIAAAAKHDIVLVEDAAYTDLRYEGAPLPSLLALDAERAQGIEQSRVLYCGTFSKTIVPGLRVGWIAAPRTVIRKLVLIKQAADLHSSQINQMVMYEVARKTLSDRTAIIRKAYRERRDAMLDALARHMPACISWTKPQGGMFMWVTLPEDIDTGALFTRALEEAQVAFVPGRAFFPDRSAANALRLNFTRADPITIDTGIRRLSNVLQATLS